MGYFVTAPKVVASCEILWRAFLCSKKERDVATTSVHSPPPDQAGGGASVQGFGRTVVKGAIWMVLARVTDRTLGMISTLVLARLLVPADYGIVAMATAVIALLDLFRAFNFDVVLIQNRQAQRRHYDTAWTFNVLLSAGVAAGLVILAFPAAHYYGEHRIVAPMYVLAIATFVGGFQNIGVVDFRKDLQFHREFLLLFLRKLVAFAVTIPLAFALRSYWALVLGILTSQAADVALGYMLHPFRPRFTFAACRELFDFSKWLALNNFIYFFVQRSPDFIVGKLGGARALGLFNMANEIAMMSVSELSAPINRATFPAYAQKAADISDLRRSYLDVLSVSTLLVLPVAGGLASLAGRLVPLLLGPNWVDAAPLVALFAIYGALHAIDTNSAYVFLALGKPRLITIVGSVRAGMLAVLLLIGMLFNGVEGAAQGCFVSIALTLPVSFFLLVRNIDLGLADLLGRLWRPAAATAAMAVAVFVLAQAMPFGDTSLEALVRLLLVAALGALAYVAGLLALWYVSGLPTGAEHYIVQAIRSRLVRRCDAEDS